MASSTLIEVFIILMVMNAISGICTEQFVDIGKQHVQLEFNFGGILGGINTTICFHGSTEIGNCFKLGARSICPLRVSSKDVYTMSSNADLTPVYVTIITFNSTTSGNYSCSIDTGMTITICVKATTDKPDGGWPDVCISGLVVGLIGVCVYLPALIALIALVYVLIELTVLVGRCIVFTWLIKGCLTRLTRRNVLIAIGFISCCCLIVSMLLFGIHKHCEQEWTDTNIAGIVVGAIGDVLSVVFGIYILCNRNINGKGHT